MCNYLSRSVRSVRVERGERRREILLLAYTPMISTLVIRDKHQAIKFFPAPRETPVSLQD